LPAIFSDHAVLQADQAIRVWGWADPGEVVTVSFADERSTTTASSDGVWRIMLPPQPATATPRDLVVATPTGTLTRRNVVVGEVWICSGQSNMEYRLSLSDGGAAYAAAADYPDIRLFKVPRNLVATQQDDVDAAWAPCSPGTAPDITAIGFHFARELQPALGVPVGIIHTAHGASAVEAWISMEALTSDPGAATVFQRTPPSEPRTPAWAWNAMVAPLAPYPLRGILWYQGETNAHWGPPAEYSQTFPLLIRAWRTAWQNPGLHALFVQLPNFNYNSSATGLIWPQLREQQLAALTLPFTGMAVAIDLGDPNDIHPRNKTEVAHRLFRQAMHRVYGQPIHAEGPAYVGHAFTGSEAVVTFTTGDGTSIVLNPGTTGFELAGTDQVFRPATAVRDGSSVRLNAVGVTAPVAIRYAWWNNPPVAVYDSAGLPAAPFRTDSWGGTGPRLMLQPLARVVAAGETAAFSIAAQGANLSYQWMHNNAELAGATSPTLELGAVQAEDAGLYRARVSDGNYTVYSIEAWLTIIGTNETLLFDPADTASGGWSVTVENGQLERTTEHGAVHTMVTAAPSAAYPYPMLSLSPPGGKADLSAHRELRFSVSNAGAVAISFTAWALSGPGWGGAPAAGQITSPTGRITLNPGATQEVVIDLHQRYPGPALTSRCIDPANLSAVKVVMQPSTGGRIAVGPVRLAGVPPLPADHPPRIVVPPAEAGDPVAGRRVLRQLTGYADTRLAHVLSLPPGWTPSGSYPVVVDYPGNVFFHLYCFSTGFSRHSNFGPSIVAGQDAILLQLPYVRAGGLDEEHNGWGDPELTAAYARAALEDAIAHFGGDSNRLLLAGFSRGAYGADYIGLRDNNIADVWHGFILSQGHPKSSGGWNGSSTGFANRLARLGTRPVFLSRATWEGAPDTTSADPGLGSNVHADIGFLEQSTAADTLRTWLQRVHTARPGTSPLTGRVVNSSGQGIANVTVHSGIHRVETAADGTFTLPGLTGASRELTFTGAAANPPGGFTVPFASGGYPAGDLTASFVITTLPTDQTVAENSDAQFGVDVSSALDVTYQWFHDGILLPEATAATLRLPAVSSAQSGVYTVVVTAADGARAEAGARLTISAALLPYFRQQPLSLIANRSGSVQFSVSAGGATPLWYQWYFNGKLLTGATRSSLTVLAGTATAGSYTVVVSNDNGSVESLPATLGYTGPAPFTAVASADCMIHDRFPTTNHNSSPLQVSARGANWNRKIYLGFSLAGALPPATAFSESELRLNFPASGSVLIGAATGMVTLKLYAITDGNDIWNETTLTWSNAPKNRAMPADGFDPTGTALLATAEIDSTTVVNGGEISFTGAALSAFLNWAAGLRGDAYGSGLAAAPDARITLMISITSATTDPGIYLVRREGAPAGAAPRLTGYLSTTAGAHLAAWRDEWFGTPEPIGSAADDADPDGDGYSNLLEYALGGNPVVAGQLVTTDHARLRFPMPAQQTDADLSIYVSADLETWEQAAETSAGEPIMMLMPGFELAPAADDADYLVFAPAAGSARGQIFYQMRVRPR
jgi:sialate O-acetylesterase